MERFRGVLRRSFLLGAAAAAVGPLRGAAQEGAVHAKPVPSTGE
jgi:hypothetical protein